jgi:chemotaxis protein MotB
MTHALRRGILLIPLVAPVLLPGCTWLWKDDYNAMQARQAQLEQQTRADAAEKQQLRQQVAVQQQQITADKTQIDRLTHAIRYTINSDMLFPSGGWRLSSDGQEIIAKFASQLAPTQQSKVVVMGYTDNTPIGPDLRRQGITSNEELSQKRAETVMAYMISQGVKPDMVSAQGHGEADPVAPNTTAQGRAQNRRVDLTLAQQ